MSEIFTAKNIYTSLILILVYSNAFSKIPNIILNGEKFQGKISINGLSAQYNSYTKVIYANTVSPSPFLFEKIKNTNISFFSKLNSEFESLVGPALNENADSHNTYVGGKINFSMSSGIATLSGFSLGVRATKSDSFGPFKGSCTITASTGPITLTNGHFDPINGSITGIKLASALPSHTQECSTNLSWIPILGHILDNFIEGKVDDYINSFIDKTMSHTNQEFSVNNFFSLNDALPDSVYIAEGRDLGKELRENAAWYLTRNDFQFSTEPYIFWEYYRKMPFGAALFDVPGAGPIKNLFSLKFSQPAIELSIDQQYDAFVRWSCEPPPRSCQHDY